jgi:hypothetical protein
MATDEQKPKKAPMMAGGWTDQDVDSPSIKVCFYNKVD